jgi:hypothetical protein
MVVVGTSLSPQATRNIGRPVGRSVGCPHASLAGPDSHKKQKTNDINSVTVTCHPVTSSPPAVPDAARSQPQSGAPQSASVACQSNPAVFPTLSFPTSPPSLPSLPPFPAQITDPTVDPNSALPYHPLGSVESSFVALSRMIAAADSRGRSSPHPASRRTAANPLVSLRPR